MKQNKDRIFVIVMGLVLANLVYFFAGATSALVTTGHWFAGIWVFADGIAIIGVLYLVRSYNRARKRTKRIEQQEQGGTEIR